MRIIGYTRRSRERRNGYGLESQEDAIRRWAGYKRAEVVDVLRDDDVSGVANPAARDGLSRALAMLSQGDADALVVAKFDRLARSLVAFADVLRLSQEQGWRLVCLDPELDFSRAAGRGMAAMLTAFADIEREAFTDRMQSARRAKADRGGYVGGSRLHRRYGYRLAEQEGEGLDYEPEPAEQEVIGEMRALREAGRTLASIADELNLQGVPGPSGPRWHAATVKRILDR